MWKVDYVHSSMPLYIGDLNTGGFWYPWELPRYIPQGHQGTI